MKTKHIVGNTTFNDGLLLPSGMLSIDNEKKALRFHDGTTVGGYEMLGVPAITGPGPQILIAGDMSAGFFGEATSSELLTYDTLAVQIGLSAGVSQYNAESIWLKFALDGKVLYVAKKPIRHSIGWDDINSANAVYEDGAQVTVGAHTLGVTLLRGAASDPSPEETGYDVPSSHGSEWNRLLYPVHSGVHAESLNPAVHTDPTAEPFGSWAQYSGTDLLVQRDFGDGRYTWVQETHPSGPLEKLGRGSRGVTYIFPNTASAASTPYGWRPCLRLIS